MGYWVSQQPWQPDGPPRLCFCEPGGWRAASFELAPQTAHIHANVLKAVRAALQDYPDLLTTGDVLNSRYQGPHSKRLMLCRLLSRKALIATFKHLHSVPACPDIRAVRDEYLRLFDEKEAAEHEQPPLFEQWSESRKNRQASPAPDSAILPPDPEPADTLEPVGPPVWRVTDAISVLAAAGAPQRIVQDLKAWSIDVQWNELQRRAKSWTEVGEMFREHQVSAKPSLGRGEARP
jgi:hypothetical protein